VILSPAIPLPATVTWEVVFVTAGVETEVITGGAGCAYTVVETLELALLVKVETGLVCFPVSVCLANVVNGTVVAQVPSETTSAVPTTTVPT
jgi:hypothetical protein